MRQSTIFLLFVAITWSCSQSNGSPMKVDPGEKLFKKYCVACHGLNGDMQLNDAKDLRESVLNQEERVLLISHGRGMMTPFQGLLTPEEIEQVAAYTLQRFKKE